MAPEPLTWLTAHELRDLVVRRLVSPVEIVEHFLARIQDVDSSLHSFLTVAADLAINDARAAESAVQSGAELGPLFGVPISIKDLFWTRGMRTTAGSLVYRDFVPAEDSVHAERVRAAGAIIVGKTNLPEFALFPRTINRLGPECLNPWDLSRSAGGSSGGAAASAAAGLTPIAVASDGGGSIRIPAAFCGVFGLYPSFGRVPKHGGFGGTLFFSGVGPISRDVRDAAILLQVLAGSDPRDPSSRKDRPPDYLESFDQGVAGKRFVWVGQSGELSELDDRVVGRARTAALRFRELGATVDNSPIGFGSEEWMEAFYVIMNADRYAAIGQELYEDPHRRGQLSEYARDHFARSGSISGVDYSRALQKRFFVIDFFERLFGDADFLLSPTVGTLPSSVNQNITRKPLVANTFMVNFAGYAAASLPCGFVDGLPVGLQIIARPNQEAALLQASRAFEVLQPWAGQRPAISDAPSAGASSEK
jgi:Asp-tRNA(Asn)/Glu-tRNA(Gln) amidotransferase A subunit family amidase